MKKEDMFMLVGVAAVVFFGARYLAGRTKNPTAKNTGIVPPVWVSEVARADGWTYYSDGTSIGPDGKYYKGSDQVYDPAGMYQ